MCQTKCSGKISSLECQHQNLNQNLQSDWSVRELKTLYSFQDLSILLLFRSINYFLRGTQQVNIKQNHNDFLCCFTVYFCYHRPVEFSEADYPQVKYQRRQQFWDPIRLALFTLAIAAIIGIAIGIVTHFVVEGEYPGHISIKCALSVP